MEVLIVGSESSGKSYLIRQLKDQMVLRPNQSLSIIENNANTNELTIPTVGVDLVTVERPDLGKIRLREIGSSMVGKWSSYFSDCSCVILVIDASDIGSFSFGYILLLEILSYSCSEDRSNGSGDTGKLNSQHSNKPVLLACNKMDMADETNITFLVSMLRLDECKHTFNHEIDLISGSCFDQHKLFDSSSSYSGGGAVVMNKTLQPFVTRVIEWVANIIRHAKS